MSDKVALLLCESEDASRLDKRALRDAGVSGVKVMTSGLEAARVLADGAPVDYIVCGQKLADMDGEQFLAIIRQHPRLANLPAILLMGNESELERARLLDDVANGFLARPYTIENLRKLLEKLAREAKSAKKPLDSSASVEAFESALATYGILLRPERGPNDYFNAGMKRLREGEWNAAIGAFRLALKGEENLAEAEMGLAAAFRGKGDQKNFLRWLARGAKSLVAAGRWQAARAAYARLIKYDAGAKNPFVSRAHCLIRAQKYKEAAKALAEGFATIQDANPADRCARLCYAAGDPDAMLKAFVGTLAAEKNPRAEEIGRQAREGIKALAREKNENARRQAAERKWELARKMEAMKKREERGIELAPEPPKAELIDEASRSPRPKIEKYSPEEETDETIIEPFARDATAVKVFGKRPSFGEFLSVMKLTWKLARLSEKKKA